MKNEVDNVDVYEIEFEQLKECEKTPLNSATDIFGALLDITVSMGSASEKIGRIINYKVGDIIELDKQVEENLDINVNGKMIASGESIIMDNRLAVRLAKIKSADED